MICNITTHSVHPTVGRSRESPNTTLEHWLALAAAPTFALMAVLSLTADGGMPGMVCSAANDPSPWTGMVAMYALMGAFHSAPWLRLIGGLRRRSQQG